MFLIEPCVGRILVQRLLLALCAPLSRAKMGGRQPFPVPRNAYEQSLAPPGYKAPVVRSQTASPLRADPKFDAKGQPGEQEYQDDEVAA